MHQAKVSASEPHVTNDKRVMIYWENYPIKNTLEDPVSCVVLFKHFTVTNTLYNYKLKNREEVILPRPWTQQTCGTISGQHRSGSLARLLLGDGGTPLPGIINQSPASNPGHRLVPDPCRCRQQRWRALCQGWGRKEKDVPT